MPLKIITNTLERPPCIVAALNQAGTAGTEAPGAAILDHQRSRFVFGTSCLRRWDFGYPWRLAWYVDQAVKVWQVSG